jgi:hypothetical protein
VALELARALTARPQHATDLLRFADLVLYEQLLAGGRIPAQFLSSIAAPSDDLLPLVQLAGYFLKRIWGVKAAVLDRLSALTDIRPANGGHMQPKQMRLPEKPSA